MEDNRRFEVDRVLSARIVDKQTGEVLAQFPPNHGECPLFSFCNCKTAMCRACLPDESCYWYRYFKNLIEENERKI